MTGALSWKEASTEVVAGWCEGCCKCVCFAERRRREGGPGPPVGHRSGSEPRVWNLSAGAVSTWSELCDREMLAKGSLSVGSGAGVGSGKSVWLAARPASNGQEKTNLSPFGFCGGEWMLQSRQHAECEVGQYSSRNDPRPGAGDPGTTSAAGETWIDRVLNLFN